MLECDSLERLKTIRTQTFDLQKEIEFELSSLAPFEKRRCLDLLSSLQKYLEVKFNLLNVERFEFHGEPIPNQKLKLQASTNTSDDLAIMKPYISDINYSKKVIDSSESHALVTRFLNCVILTKESISSINIRKGSDSVIYLNCDGPIFAHDLENCVLILDCHQLRLHNTQNCTILPIVSNNRVVIEKCHSLKFVNLNDGTSPLVDDFSCPSKEIVNKNYAFIERNNLMDYNWIFKLDEGPLCSNLQKTLADYLDINAA